MAGVPGNSLAARLAAYDKLLSRKFVERLLQRRLIYKGYDPKFHLNTEFTVTKF